MTLLAADDPVFVVDLIAELAGNGDAADSGDGRSRRDNGPPPVPELPIAAVALLVAEDADPLLLEIPPTRDTVLLDALARLLRVAVREGATLQQVASHGDDPLLQSLMGEGKLPPFVYAGPPEHVRARMPPRLAAIFDSSRDVEE